MCNQEKVEKAIKGNKKAFQELIMEKKSSLYRMAYMYVKNENDALDVVQESTYKAYTAIKNLKDPQYFSTWLTRIVINTALDFNKKKENRYVTPIQNTEEFPERAENQIEEKMDLVNAINQLDSRSKTIIILRYYRDFPIKEIARTLNCPEGTVKTQLHRATNKLKTHLKRFKEGGIY